MSVPPENMLLSPDYRNRMMGIAGALLQNGGWQNMPVANAPVMADAIAGYQQGAELDRAESLRQLMPQILQEAPISFVQKYLMEQMSPENAYREAMMARQMQQDQYQKEQDLLDRQWQQQTRKEDTDWRDRQAKLDEAKFDYQKQHNMLELEIARGNLGVSQANLGLKKIEMDLQNKLREIMFGSDKPATTADEPPDPNGRPPLSSFDRY